jgi:hypothetical protein
MGTSTQSQPVSHNNLSNNGDEKGSDTIERAQGKIFGWQLEIKVLLPLHLLTTSSSHVLSSQHILNIFISWPLFSVINSKDRIDNYLHDLELDT